MQRKTLGEQWALMSLKRPAAADNKTFEMALFMRLSAFLWNQVPTGQKHVLELSQKWA